MFVSRCLRPVALTGGGEVLRKKTLWQQIQEGGWVMIPIGLTSVATLYLIGDGMHPHGSVSALPRRSRSKT